METRKIELLAPAKDCRHGRAAIDHGADAVYIGAPKFSARAAAGNPIEEIRQLIDHAHGFHARVYVALNTLLHDDELQEARDIICRLYEIGADALIIQDMGLLECDLPPIPLHASTQTDNRTVEKVRFLEDVGFSRVVLARELSLSEIKSIRSATTVALEFFVHGALCVCYSGRCTFSEKVSGRSADRGRCAQFCRHSYILKDGSGALIKDRSYLLSLKDLNLSSHLQDLIATGVTSLKIEGRLKDIDYVKNVTAHYRRTLDALFDRDPTLLRASSGRCSFSFTPDPERTFNRSGGPSFLFRDRNLAISLNTPKSTGKKIGKVLRTSAGFFEVETDEEIANGDGLCFFDGRNRLVGFRVNKTEGMRVFPKDRVSIEPGTILYRNLDTAFHRLLQKSEDCRKVGLVVTVFATAGGLGTTIVDDDGYISSEDIPLAKERARDPEMMRRSLSRQMKKSGGTIFAIHRVTIDMGAMLYLPLAAINDIRRKAFDHHLQVRRAEHTIPHRPLLPNSLPWPPDHVLPPEHIKNTRAGLFSARHQCGSGGSAAADRRDRRVLMTCRYCLKAELALCPQANRHAGNPVPPLTISDKTGTYELAFDCRRCEMQVLLIPAGKKALDRK